MKAIPILACIVLAFSSCKENVRNKNQDTYLYNYGDYLVGMMAAFDSIFVADSSKMYEIESKDFRKIQWVERGGSFQYFKLAKQ